MNTILAQAETQGNPLLGLLILIAIAAVIVYLARRVYAGAKKTEADKAAAQAAFNALSPEEKAAIQAKKEKEKTHFSGRYMRGHPALPRPIQTTNCQLAEDDILIYSPVSGKLGPVVGKIPLSQVQNVVVEDKSTVEKRVTMTRVLAIGVFALAAKKKEVHPEFYLTISWGGGKIGNETIFEFDGENAQVNANALRNEIAKRVNDLTAA